MEIIKEDLQKEKIKVKMLLEHIEMIDRYTEKPITSTTILKTIRRICKQAKEEVESMGE